MPADPETLYSQLVAGNPEQARATASALAYGSGKLQESVESADRVRSAVDGWAGDASAAFARRVDTTTASARLAHEQFTAAKQAIENVARTYAAVRQSADQIIAFWRLVVILTGGARTPELDRRISDDLHQLRDTYGRQLRAQASALARLTPAFQKTAGHTDSWQSTRPQAAPRMPPPGSDPRDVASWWKSLTDEHRDQLLATGFTTLGQMQGLPADVVDTANRRRIDVDQRRFSAAAADLDRRAQERAGELGIALDENSMREANDPLLSDLLDKKSDAERRSDNAQAASANLGKALHDADLSGLPRDEIYVLAYSPDGPGRKEGTLAAAFGNPDTARNVAVTVPGTGTTIGSDFTGQAANLRGQMGGGAQNATIAWLGYDAPDWDQSVASDIGAKEGAHSLVSDVNGYRAAAEAAGTPRQHLSVVGHSYGSATVGYAGMNGLAADDIAFVGSPGVGASDVDQLSAGAGHVWSGGNEHDPVIQGTNGTYFTEDGSSSGPYDPRFGANQFDTDAGVGIKNAHTTYYDRGSDSLRNLGHIATGNYDAVSERSYFEEPIAPGATMPLPPGGSTIAKVGYEGAQVMENLVTGDYQGAAQDFVDANVTAVGGAIDTVKEGSKVVANALGIGKLF